MSRIGKLPIKIPAGVTVEIEPRAFSASGGKGSLSIKLPKHVKLDQQDDQIIVSAGKHPEAKAYWGLARTLVSNVITGVSEGFSKQLEVQGVGYRVQVTGDKVTLNLGYSHPIEYQLPETIQAVVEANIVTISGIDKQLVGQVAAEIRGMRKPEPYKGKGIRYVGELVRRKAGKAAAKAVSG